VFTVVTDFVEAAQVKDFPELVYILKSYDQLQENVSKKD